MLRKPRRAAQLQLSRDDGSGQAEHVSEWGAVIASPEWTALLIGGDSHSLSDIEVRSRVLKA